MKKQVLVCLYVVLYIFIQTHIHTLTRTILNLALEESLKLFGCGDVFDMDMWHVPTHPSKINLGASKQLLISIGFIPFVGDLFSQMQLGRWGEVFVFIWIKCNQEEDRVHKPLKICCLGWRSRVMRKASFCWNSNGRRNNASLTVSIIVMQRNHQSLHDFQQCPSPSFSLLFVRC